MSTNRPENEISGTATTPATPPTPPGGPPVASPAPDLGSPGVDDEARDAVRPQADFLADVAACRQKGA